MIKLLSSQATRDAAVEYQESHPRALPSDAFLAGVEFVQKNMTVSAKGTDIVYHNRRIAHVRPEPIKELR